MNYGLVLAGGRGSRLYPLSRTNKPKQFLNILNDKSLLSNTLNRVSNLIDKENIYVVTNKDYKEEVYKDIVGFINESNVIIEPLNKETAVCIGLVAVKLLKKDKDAVITIFPSDHYIDEKNSSSFYDSLNCCIDLANKKRGLITIGINPTSPETGYGYIKLGREGRLFTNNYNSNVFKVDRFIEKPNFEVAKGFLLSGDYLWNSGIFCFRADVYLREMEKYLADIYKAMVDIYKSLGEEDEDSVIRRVYDRIEGISIDFGIMQKTRKAYVVLGDFKWDDIGSFTSIARILKEDGLNFIKGNVLAEESENCLVFGQENLVITFGVKDLIVVNAGDVVLIMDKSKEQELKHLFDLIRKNKEFDNFI